MKITLVMASDEEGGLEKHVLELAAGLSQAHEVSLIAHQKYQSQVESSVNFVAIDMSGSRYNPWTKYLLKKTILGTEPQVLHAHASKTAKLLQGMIAGFDFPCVVTIHGAKKKIDSYLAFDHIICVSKRLAQIVGQPEKLSVVYNGISLNMPAQSFVKNRKFIAIGRLNEVKGFDLLLAAWRNISHQLTIVGDGEEREKLEQLIQEYQLADRVHLYGYSDNIHPLITDHEALIVSSLREGGPYTLAESLLLQRPVLGTDVGMMAEFIPVEFLCEPNNIEALQQVIQNYLDVVAPEASFKQAYALAQEQLTFTKMIDNTVKVYQSLLSA
ncbi:glycosyltransferase [Acinetobacter baumannii]|uniref:glycosyltransferase n=1 Tax=Acinetobacter baumannii TaxID=470 RepID=UPI0024C43A8A|nr:glycosyltransferase [Acinetobacter baumannii]MCZ3130088.1 glycosyltransferase [Acinetobacter baumannii]MDK1593812.1 glycosyltransferase [Acinetobacter baumannii]